MDVYDNGIIVHENISYYQVDAIRKTAPEEFKANFDSAINGLKTITYAGKIFAQARDMELSIPYIPSHLSKKVK